MQENVSFGSSALLTSEAACQVTQRRVPRLQQSKSLKHEDPDTLCQVFLHSSLVSASLFEIYLHSSLVSARLFEIYLDS